MKINSVTGVTMILQVWLVWCEDCYQDSVCLPLLHCSPVYRLLENVKQEPDDSLLRRNLIHHVRGRVCGEREERMVCCPLVRQDMKIGSFSNVYHDVSGDVFVLDSHSLIIKNFSYDGTAPDAFFIAGSSGEPDNSYPDAVLSFPFTGEHYELEDSRIQRLEMFQGEEELVLTLPPDLPVTSLQWVSVWCRQYGIDFGHVIFS